MGDKAAPFTPKEVQQEAQKLEKLADDFVTSKNQQGAFDAWHKELREISLHGVQSTREVFHQMEQDKNKGWRISNPVQTNDVLGHAQLVIHPSSQSRWGARQHLGAVVDNELVLSTAQGKRGARFAAMTHQVNDSWNPFYRNPFEKK